MLEKHLRRLLREIAILRRAACTKSVARLRQTALAPTAVAPETGSHLPHLHRDWAVYPPTGTGMCTLPTSALGLGVPLPSPSLLRMQWWSVTAGRVEFFWLRK